MTDTKVMKWREISKNCDHTNHTEKIGNCPACFCAKFLNVITKGDPKLFDEFSAINLKITMRLNHDRY